MLPNVGWMELTVILLVLLLVFGPQRLTGLGASLGRALREFRQALRDAEEEEPHTPRTDRGGPQASA
ncbi:MAG: twin-arginine translocase TatA/TatE family subunit [Armatimonadota bacterium]|nr:twin-arginine translocase TatA/TatE family subunit [Armatimonadota bacterium]MDR7447666.1 twin-arginine translocase TatA/TatE family subunit [Armatimonadota bacterium]MDR7459001.1 twin-arginine translocase TatA/TatE family subunit [Armatimonadota bacterium]MDR7480102.1 twin-arginine translocase TatA/TatE family subunit [Armatimonadota bacterium]MDR7489555.1 twin-arginine translocase TatA/TatE family subunit [Armatimonadota bacterium]